MKNVKKAVLSTTIAVFAFTSVLATPTYNINDNYSQIPKGQYNKHYNPNNSQPNNYYNTNGNYQEGYNYPYYDNSAGFEQFFIFGFFTTLIGMMIKMITD
ncbi:MAG: hypothetical protein GKC53_05730 [Neisseriaceae bacterium]|nr:MAG: hypothetical protein GKC53_05730 [Neisseriaceae bacterium]